MKNDTVDMKQVLNQKLNQEQQSEMSLGEAKRNLKSKIEQISKSNEDSKAKSKSTRMLAKTLYPLRSMKDVEELKAISSYESVLLDKEFSDTFESDKLNCFVYTFSPKMALHILKERMVKNRFVNVANVKSCTDALRNGRWQENGESLKVNKNLKLNDGQHRLMACWNSQKPLTTVVATGVDTETYTTIDQGKVRSLYDHLEMKIGVMEKMQLKPSSRGEEARCKKAIEYARGFSLSMNDYSSIGTDLRTSDSPTGNTAIDTAEFLEENVFNQPRHLDALNWFEKESHRLKLIYPQLSKTTDGRSTLFARLQGCAVPIIQYRVLQPEKAEDFLSKLYVGSHVVVSESGPSIQSLEGSDPIMRLRVRLQNDDGRLTGTNENIDNLYLITQRAIHKHFAGESCQFLRGSVKRKTNGKNDRQIGVGIKYWSIPDHLEDNSPVEVNL